MVRRFIVAGRVQGVFFRDSTRREALSLSIAGSARNLPDGTVEVIACGEAASIDRLERWLHQGPPMAKVTSVREVDAPLHEYDSFTIA